MPHIRYAPETHQDFARFSAFLLDVAPEKVGEAINAIMEAIEILGHAPLIGEAYPLEKVPDLRKLVISYGRSGYIALYSYDKDTDLVTIQAIRHQRELDATIAARF